MSQYATTTELAQFGLTAAAAGAFTTDEMNGALQAASSIADGYIGGRFELPLTTWGVDLKLHVSKMAAWLLMSRRGFKPGVTDAESLRAGWNDAIAWLKDVSTGKVTPFEGTGGVEDADGDELAAGDAPFVVSPNSAAPNDGTDRLERFLGHDSPAAVGVVGPARLRGWN